MTSIAKLKFTIDKLKNALNDYSLAEIRYARDLIDKTPRRCYYKLKEIDEKFDVCRDVDTFVDLCGGPGQFAKYVFSTNPDCVGYGVTLRNDCDYTFDHEHFRKIYGCFDSGDIFDANVMFELMYFCRNRCNLVVADGAFDVTARENDQETLTLSLLRKECYIILEVLRTGGNCVLKIFDTFNRATVSLLQSFIANFTEFHIYKPTHSRAANSEKYLVCKGRLETPVNIVSKRQFDTLTRQFGIKQKGALQQLLNILKNERHASSSSSAESFQNRR
ncbi:MTASE [Mythimna sequax nucleopolyhedrovirus]|nr:MTASE [Mythimna sequax nucleopolyhedrovirus]